MAGSFPDHCGKERLDSPEMGKDVDTECSRDVTLFEVEDELARNDTSIVDDDSGVTDLRMEEPARGW